MFVINFVEDFPNVEEYRHCLLILVRDVFGYRSPVVYPEYSTKTKQSQFDTHLLMISLPVVTFQSVPSPLDRCLINDGIYVNTNHVWSIDREYRSWKKIKSCSYLDQSIFVRLTFHRLPFCHPLLGPKNPIKWEIDRSVCLLYLFND